MTKKIFRSIFIVALAVFLAGIGIATNFLYGYFNTSQQKQLKAELSLVAESVNTVGIEYFDNFDSTMFRFTVVDEDGAVLRDTQADIATMENHREREEIAEAFQTGSGRGERISSTLMEKTLYEAQLLDNGDVLRISVSRLTMGALIVNMLPTMFVIAVFAAIVAMILAHSMAKNVTEPLMQLDLDPPVEDVAYEELKPILTKLQKQHKQIREQMKLLQRKTDEFDQIIYSMNEGLVLLDEHGMVLSMNTSAKRIFDVKKEIAGCDFLTIDCSSKMSRTVWMALEGKNSEYTEERNGAQYQFTINPIESFGKVLGAVILIFDISDRTFAERNRREFTANVTHELKTPLQSIIGSAELLESGLVKPEDTGRFVGNIRKEATRLVSLINDIIRLSQLDEEHEPATEKVELMQVAQDVVEVLFEAANRKNITLCIEGENCEIYGVRRYVYEIIYNLCDNSIRYSREHDKVNIFVGRNQGHTVITVSDTGIGIAPEHQTRIFERFYRVDKSHSKETGGTGLGLSIVKHAVQYHGGKIEMESEPEKGTTIKVIF